MHKFGLFLQPPYITSQSIQKWMLHL